MLQRIFFLFLIFISLAKLECKNDEIICYPKNGLGNILSCLVSSAVMAEEENREFQVYWNAILPSWRDLFVSPKLNLITKLPLKACYIGMMPDVKGHWTRLPLLKTRGKYLTKEYQASDFIYFDHFNTVDIPEHIPVIVSTISDFKLLDMENDLFKERKLAFYNKLVPVKYVRDRVERIYTRRFTSKTIGLHFRSTDALVINGKRIPPAYKYFVEEMQKELLKDPEVNFYVSADQIHAYKFFKSKFKERVFFYGGHDFNEQGEVVRDTIKSQKDALVDIFLLSKTHKIIGTLNSSFGKIASEIGNIPIKHVFHQ